MGYYCTICGDKITGEEIICDACKVSVGEAISSYTKLIKDYGEKFVGKILAMSDRNFERLKEFMQLSASLPDENLKKLLIMMAEDKAEKEEPPKKKKPSKKVSTKEDEPEDDEILDTEDEDFWLEDDEDDPYVKMLKKS